MLHQLIYRLRKHSFVAQRAAGAGLDLGAQIKAITLGQTVIDNLIRVFDLLECMAFVPPFTRLSFCYFYRDDSSVSVFHSHHWKAVY